MKVSELGEFGLIELLSRIVNQGKNPRDASWQRLVAGIGDDAAVWQEDKSLLLATIDTLVQDVHFKLDITNWEELGWKALAVNLSDIAAMGGNPKYALVSLALPGELELEHVSDLYQGMVKLAQEFGVAIVGGDVISAQKVVLTITVLGKATGKSILTRSSAIPGDKIAVTGCLGASASGLKMLTQRMELEGEEAKILREAHLQPRPRVKEGQLMAKQGIKTAIDISDGLLSDLRQICKASKVGAQLRIDKVPVHPIVKKFFAEDYLELALTGGEDYELLFSGTSKVIDKVKQSLSCRVTVIGEITREKPGEITIIDEAGNAVPWERSGWEHFK